MFSTSEFYSYCRVHDVDVIPFDRLPAAATTVRYHGAYAVGLNFSRLHTVRQIRTAMLHESGHLHTGALHKVNSPFQLVEQNEYRADADAFRRSLPPDTSRDIYRIRLTGETAEPLTLAPLERALSGEFFRLELRDDTRLRRDLWDRCGDDTLRGLFLGQLRREYDGADPRRQKEIEQAVRFGLAAMDNTIDS